MKKFSMLFILLFVAIAIHQVVAEEVQFISQSRDSLIQQTYCWQPGNLYRPIFPLDGEWEYRITEKESYKKVILPASCSYWGEITFRKNITPDSTFKNHFFRLICYGINYYCRIFINEKFIGSHAGGYTSFAYDIADGIIKINQKNTIEIKVDTRLDSRNTIPHRFQPEGVEQTAGIIRSLYLLAIPELSIEDVVVDYQFIPDFSQCELELKINLKDRIDNITNQEAKKQKPAPLYYYTELRSKDNDNLLLQERQEIDIQDYLLTRTISTRFKIAPQMWSPESPHLYSLRIQLLRDRQIIDQFDQSLGIKQIEFRDGNIFLNGNRLVLQGVSWIEDYRIAGALFDRNQLVQDLLLTKQLHANAIRVYHHPAHPMLTSLCDSLGLLLLQEIPLDWIPTQRFGSDIFFSQCRDLLNETISRDQSHVSVFALGIGGHFLLTDSTSRNFLNRICSSLNTYNNQTYYIWDSPFFYPNENDVNMINGISIFNLKKDLIHTKLAEWIGQNKGRINIVLSYGAPQLAAYQGNDKRALFEEYQVLQIVDAWQAINNFPEIDGYFISSFSDYHGNYPATIYNNGDGNKVRPFGLTEHDRKRRVAFETIRALYQEAKTRYNPGVDIKDEPPASFAVIGLAAILIFLFTINSRRYFRENFKRIFIHPHGFYVDLRDGRKTPFSHTILMALLISVGWGLVLASMLTFYKNQLLIDHLITLLLPSQNLKMKICYLSWNPGWAVLFFMMLSLLAFFLIALYFKFFAIITRKHCSIGQCLIIPFWLGGNLVFLIPMGMVLFRIMQYQNLVIPIFISFFLTVAWFILRIAKGMRVMFIWTISRAFFVLIITIIILLAGLLYFYQSQYSLLDYLKYYYQLGGPMMLNSLLP